MVSKELLEYLEKFITPRRNERINTVLTTRTRHFKVAIEDVYQLHNTSAVMRSCDIFGVQDMYVIEENNVKTIDREIAMGAQKWVDLHRYNSASACIKDLKKEGCKIVAMTPHANDELLEDFDISEPSCFFFVSEKEGLSDTVLNQADCFLKIPMVGFTESLNVSVAAAITLHSLTQKLYKSDVSWTLNEVDKDALKLKWIERSLKDFKKIVTRFNSLS